MNTCVYIIFLNVINNIRDCHKVKLAEQSAKIKFIFKAI